MSKRSVTSPTKHGQLLSHPGLTRRGEFSADGRFVLTSCHSAGSGARVRLWNATTGNAASNWIDHGEPFAGFDFAPAGDRFLTCGSDGVVRLFETSDARPLAEFASRSGIADAVWSPDGDSLLVAGTNKSVRMLCAASGQQRFPPWKIPRSPDASGPARPMQISPGGRWLAVVAGVQVTLIDLRRGSPGPVLKHRLRVVDMAWRGDDRLITASDDYVVRQWHWTKQAVAKEIHRTPRWIWSLECSRDGRRLLIGAEDEMVRAGHPGSGHAELIEIATGQAVIPWLPHDGTALARFSPDERRIVTGSADRTVAVWDAASGERLCLWKYGWMTHGVRFSPAGDRVLAVGGRDAAIWPID